MPYVDLRVRDPRLRQSLLDAATRVFDRGDYVLGTEVQAFESRFLQVSGTDYAVGVANGTEALYLALKGLGIGPGDDVLTVPNSFVSTTAAIALTGAKPVFVDVAEDFNVDVSQIEAAIGPRTRAIIPVHLTGRPADMDAILAIAEAHGITVVEDAAQAVGAIYRGRPVGCFGKVACFSLHPLKNLGCLGDGGVVTTDDPSLYEWLLAARNNGLRSRDDAAFWSLNSRLDTIQAAWAGVRLDLLAAWTKSRRRIATTYCEALKDVVKVPQEIADGESVWHTFVIEAERRDDLKQYLLDRGVDTRIHYPVPIHLQEAARELGYKVGDFPVAERQAGRILSLPIYPDLEDDQVDLVISSIRAFFGAT